MRINNLWRSALIALVMLAGTGWAAPETLTVTSGTATLAISKYDALGPAGVLAYRIAWTCDAAGRVTLSTQAIAGTITKLVTNPGATAPTDNYDILLNDEDGADVLNAKGQNRDTANTEVVAPMIGDGTTTNQLVDVNGVLTLLITNAGNAKNGELILYVRR
jgi:hypothetical protein